MMERNPKKTTIIFCIFIFLYVEFLFYLIAGAYEQGMDLSAYFQRLPIVLAHPFHLYFSPITVYCLVFGCLISGFAFILELAKPDTMPGRECGTARWASAKQITKRFTKRNDMATVRIYSKNVRISTDPSVTKINNNTLIIGGSGTQKTWSTAQPNLWNENGSFVITDPKGELLARNGNRLIRNGYMVKVLNLVNMKQSDCYNPFVYIRESSDVLRLIDNLVINTESPESRNHAGDPFWLKAEKMFLQALFYYVWLEEPKERQSMNRVMELLDMASYQSEDEYSELDNIMEALEIRKGVQHLAVLNYRRVMKGAGDTIRSIIISANARLAAFTEPDIMNIFSRDDFDLATIGTGVGLDKKTKTAVFCVIPDNEKTYNFIIGMFYTQLCKELYTVADQVYHGNLPIGVSLWFDEFANVPLPNDFDLWISTMRSRNISCIVILQNLTQIKALFDKKYENIIGNCDVFVYLGGNELSTHEYVSKILGKTTIYKKNMSISKGRNGSSSVTYDPVGRELMTPSEVSLLPHEKCIIKVRGVQPVIDDKYPTFTTPDYRALKEEGVYVHQPKKAEKVFRVLSQKELESYKKEALIHPDKIQISTFSLSELLDLVEAAKKSPEGIKNIPGVPIKEKIQKAVHREQLFNGKSLSDIFMKYTLSEEQLELVNVSLKKKLTEDQIICLLNKKNTEWDELIEIFSLLNQTKKN